jgi:hypothetical protein
MLEHHLQKEILSSLVIRDSARFAELKPKEIDGNIFTYHLHQLIKQKYVVKTEDGRYQLTSTGKRLGITSQLNAQELLEEAHPVLFLVVRDGNRWLVRRRLAHPTYGMFGFVHGEPLLRQDVCRTAAEVLRDRTGLEATFKPRGSGYIRIFKDTEQESFTQFTLLEAHDISGELIPKMRNGENVWVEDPDFTAPEMLPSMADLAAKLAEPGEFFFADLKYDL